jgi:hypothetical protein
MSRTLQNPHLRESMIRAGFLRLLNKNLAIHIRGANLCGHTHIVEYASVSNCYGAKARTTPPQPRGARADHRGDEEAAAAAKPDLKRAAQISYGQEIDVGGRAAEGGGCESAGRRGGIADGHPAACPASCPHSMPLNAYDRKGLAAARRERVEAAVAAGHRLAQPYGAWIAADPFRGGVRVLITGSPGRRPSGFERTIGFARDAAPTRIVRPAVAPAHGRSAEETLGKGPKGLQAEDVNLA